MLTRRAMLCAVAGGGLAMAMHARPATGAEAGGASFKRRGAVVAPSDLETWPWPAKAKEAGLTTLALHAAPSKVEAFIRSEAGSAFLESCKRLAIEVEYEMHAINDLLPRELFAKDPAMFRMNEAGQRTADANLCVSSEAAVASICERAVGFAAVLKPSTGRYYYWIDDGQPMCRCGQCKGLSDSEQALVLENRLVQALRGVDPRATLAHLCYHNTLAAPVQVKPERGVFLEFAPIERQSDIAIDSAAAPKHAELLAALDANLAVFGAADAQILEYWLDVSRFCGWKRENLKAIPWDAEVVRADARAYAGRGIANATTFAVWADGTYVQRFGEPPLRAYATALGAA